MRHYYYYPILQDTGTSIIFFPISAALMPFLRLFVPQCNKIYSGLFDIVGYMYNFMSLVVASLKCFVTTLLFLSDNSNSVTSLTTDAPKITVTGSFSCVLSFCLAYVCYFSRLRFLCFGCCSRCYYMVFSQIPLIHAVLDCHFDCPH